MQVLRERRTGRSCGFGFVTMGTVEEAEAAIQMFEGKGGVFPVIDENVSVLLIIETSHQFMKLFVTCYFIETDGA